MASLSTSTKAQLLSAYDTSTGIVLVQVQIACTPLMRRVGAVIGSPDRVLVVADALHAQVGRADRSPRTVFI
ncbi:hypothetical protein [Actinoplanes sp. NPDC049802]|uniref:hypothetical protein n=1 Tax=Actinoplanes sp. NPDC049802 TaxID=3154742 RepID=UPI0033EE1271